jgi:hypothetical protein
MNLARRPNPWQWTRYAWGAGLPEDLNAWVLRDTTGRTWLLRVVARSLFQIAPGIILLLVVMPGAFWIRGVAVIGGTAMALFYGLAFSVGTAEHRLVKAGYPLNMGEDLRVQRSADAHNAAVRARQAKRATRS